jgi:hypothetical protein
MNRLFKTMALTLVMGMMLFMAACNRNQTETTTVPETPEVTQEDHAHAPGTLAHSHEAQVSGEDWVQLEQYRFRLSPDIESNGEAHLDLYVHDANDQHVPGAKAIANLTAADGHKLTVNLSEDKAGGHYAGKTALEDMGEYQAVVQVTINGKQLNPRFSFSRNQ